MSSPPADVEHGPSLRRSASVNGCGPGDGTAVGGCHDAQPCSSGCRPCSSPRSASPTGAPGPRTRRTRWRRSGWPCASGATGLESDVWLTADGVPVLDHDGVVRRSASGAAISSLTSADAAPGPHPDAGRAVRRLRSATTTSRSTSRTPRPARPSSSGAGGRRRPARPALALPPGLAGRSPRSARSTPTCGSSTRPGWPHQGGTRAPGRHPGRARASTPSTSTTATGPAASPTLFHRFDRYAFGWDVQHERCSRTLLRMGHRRRVQRPRRPHDRRLPRRVDWARARRRSGRRRSARPDRQSKPRCAERPDA